MDRAGDEARLPSSHQTQESHQHISPLPYQLQTAGFRACNNLFRGKNQTKPNQIFSRVGKPNDCDIKLILLPSSVFQGHSTGQTCWCTWAEYPPIPVPQFPQWYNENEWCSLTAKSSPRSLSKEKCIHISQACSTPGSQDRAFCLPLYLRQKQIPLLHCSL